MLQGAVLRQAEDLLWCPDEYRAEYLQLRAKKFHADEARQIILDHIEVMNRRAKRSA